VICCHCSLRLPRCAPSRYAIGKPPDTSSHAGIYSRSPVYHQIGPYLTCSPGIETIVLFHYASSADVIARFTVRRFKVWMGLQIVVKLIRKVKNMRVSRGSPVFVRSSSLADGPHETVRIGPVF
jgi:hypothetical protein